MPTYDAMTRASVAAANARGIDVIAYSLMRDAEVYEQKRLRAQERDEAESRRIQQSRESRVVVPTASTSSWTPPPLEGLKPSLFLCTRR